jgi:riboflavin kinase / FMN adenylyltransferase
VIIVTELDAASAVPRALAIGTFDGVHVGHREVIGRAVRIASDRGLTSTVVTFEHHPLATIAPEREPRALTPLALKSELIAELGVDELIVLRFDTGLAGLSADEFCDTILRRRLDAAVVVVGRNFSFGAGGRGTADTLHACGERLGFETVVVPLAGAGGRPISSTRIRRLLESGELAEARAILGRPPRATGAVVRGFQRGAKLGFPTANIEAETGTMFPGRGVYAARALVDGRWYRAAVNVGHNPTFVHHGDETGVVHVEAFLLGFEGDIYGDTVRVDFLTRVRIEERFEYVDDLVAQMRRDIDTIAAIDDPAFADVGL